MQATRRLTKCDSSCVPDCARYCRHEPAEPCRGYKKTWASRTECRKTTKRTGVKVFDSLAQIRLRSLNILYQTPIKIRPAIAKEAECGAVLLGRCQINRRHQHARLLSAELR